MMKKTIPTTNKQEATCSSCVHLRICKHVEAVKKTKEKVEVFVIASPLSFLIVCCEYKPAFETYELKEITPPNYR